MVIVLLLKSMYLIASAFAMRPTSSYKTMKYLLRLVFIKTHVTDRRTDAEVIP